MSREESIQEAARRRSLKLMEDMGETMTPKNWDDWSQSEETGTETGGQEEVQERMEVSAARGEEPEEEEDELTVILGDDDRGRETSTSYSPITSPISEWGNEAELEEEPVAEMMEGEGVPVGWDPNNDLEDWRRLMEGINFETKMMVERGVLVSDEWILVFERREEVEPEIIGARIEETREEEIDDIIWV
ncbi:hypothetical protein WN55_09808 [Dufourea novaeangliae]|uniref:Uncharacterized protein n=1 Tax=Dufourea novaeangliae TaxID=178035 RepID=A0A154PT45_DUFNO|nr:hypothetical protein WN55_09808 [Dufourea novaeangliae]